MDQFMPLIKAFYDFLMLLLGNLGILGEDKELPAWIEQYMKDGKTVFDAAIK